MSRYAVSKFLFTYNKEQALRDAFAVEPEQAMRTFTLTERERAALTAFDFRTLYDSGIHPLLLTALANGAGIPILSYFESLRSGQPVPPAAVGATFSSTPSAGSK